MAFRTIVLKGDPIRKEAKAGGTITPGHLLYYSAADTVKVHASSGQPTGAMFAIENSLEGGEIGDDYSTGDRVQYVHARPGDEIYAWLKDGENVSVGDYLQSGGNGDLIKYVASSAGKIEYPNSIVAVALEAVNLSASSNTTHGRIKIAVV
ncbi:MAG: hypothetical protein JRJ78_15830 [Deltaproteobacteria bacterium]|nr:hypothetical protein [Deltaproteobacteria bacterium]